MSSEFEQNLERYAELIVKVGLNLQPGQRLLIGAPAFFSAGAPIQTAPLVRLIAASAYEAGAKLVDVMWSDDALKLARHRHAPRDSFEEYPAWRSIGALEYAKRGDAVLLVLADDPDLLAEQDPELVNLEQKTSFKQAGPFMEQLVRSAMNWSAISASVPGWAAKVFPEHPAAAQEMRLWDTIFDICRVKQADPVSAWRAHIEQLGIRAEFLNQKQYKALKFVALGTDLTVGLPNGHVWRSGGLTSERGIFFAANMPTEEVFTMPHKHEADGFVTATKPLSFAGTLIENFSLKFAEGRVVEATADRGGDILQKLIETDKGACRLGEVALVPHSSPISQSGLLFYNILIDENAANHMALGQAYKFSMEDGEDLSDEEFEVRGGNQSLIHIDFMIGSAEMDVDGISENGSIEPIMRAGEWAIDVA
jgi:aminopeptidase